MRGALPEDVRKERVYRTGRQDPLRKTRFRQGPGCGHHTASEGRADSTAYEDHLMILLSLVAQIVITQLL